MANKRLGSWMHWGLVSLLGGGGAIVITNHPTLAQVVADPSLNTVVPPGCTNCQITGGTAVGNNLFHSFSRFDVPTDGIADFQNALTITNIFARITGGTPSTIDGLIRTQGTANLFLINPRGILFGPGSRLNVGGSFVATTANAFQFPGGAEFSITSAVNPANSLLSVNPSAFLFNQIHPEAIVNQSSNGLQVPLGQSLSLLGGEVQLQGGSLVARGGRIELGSVAGSGIVYLNSENQSLSFPNNIARGDISIVENSLVNVLGSNGGSITVYAQNLTISGSTVAAGIRRNSGSPTSQAGDITLNALADIKVTNGNIFNVVQSRATGNAGAINIQTQSLSLNASYIDATTYGQGNGGNINVDVENAVVISGNQDQYNYGIYSDVDGLAQGRAGNISLRAGSLLMSDGGILSTQTYGKGDAGKVNIDVRGAIQLVGTGANLTNDNRTEIVTAVRGKGQGGDITIRAGSLSMEGVNAVIDPMTYGIGNAGNVTINVDGAVSLTESRLYSSVSFDAEGNGGNANIQAHSLFLTKGAFISVNTFNKGNAGNVFLDIRDKIFLSDGYIQSNVYEDAQGNSGSIQAKANSITLVEGGQMSASTFGQGNAGNILVQARTINANGAILDPTNGTSTGVSIDGKIRSGFFTETHSSNDAGILQIMASGLLNLHNEAMISASTYAEGKGGEIRVQAGNLNLKGGAEIISRSKGIGKAGDVYLNVDGTLESSGGSISTTSEKSSGGTIAITARDIRLFNNSDITTSVFSGANNGGNIVLNANSIVALDDSDILAFAQDGKGGNITLNTPVFVGQNYRPASPGTNPLSLNGNNRVDINASGLVSGIVALPDTTYLQRSMIQLPENLIDTNRLLANSCIVRNEKSGGVFLVTGTGGLPVRPGDAPLSSFATGEVRSLANETSSQAPKSESNPIVEAEGIYQLPDGQVILSWECRK